MKNFEFDLHNEHEIYEFGKMANSADGSAVLRVGANVLLGALSIGEDPQEEDFLPLTVNYVEKTYANGKIPGGFFKREAKPSEFETLTSRIIDRTIRPLFPKGFNYPVVLTIMALSVDENADLQRLALLCANATIANSPLKLKLVSAVRVSRIKNNLFVNLPLKDQEKSDLDLFVAGSKDELLMIEMQTKKSNEPMENIIIDPSTGLVAPQSIYDDDFNIEISEDELNNAISMAKDALGYSCQTYEQFGELKPKKDYKLLEITIDENVENYIRQNKQQDIKDAISLMAKTERGGFLKAIAAKTLEEQPEFDPAQINLAVEKIKKELVRKGVLDEQKRADGRSPKDIRPISIETNILPKAHGSVLFTRGQTQAIVVATLGGDSDRQSTDLLTNKQPVYDDFMLHYNFHPFCVNEARPPRAPGRRELGHGNLAKRALEASLPDIMDSSVRLVSEILESNGSSSMATVCGGSLALKAANINTKKLVAGVAMGLVSDETRQVVLSDITGLEDHDGDMDFKVAGTKDGLTALQMDIKLGGISKELLEQALNQAKESRLHILNIMEEAVQKMVINQDALPKTEIFSVGVDKIVDIIGQAGKTIKELIETFEVSIDLDREKGGVKVRGDDSSRVDGAVNRIKEIVSSSASGKFGKREKKPNKDVNFNKGEVLNGKVEKILEFGMLVKLPDETIGMVHISKVANKRVSNLAQYFKEGADLNVIFVSQDSKTKKIELDLEQKLEL